MLEPAKDAQEFFNRVAKHLLEQGEKALSSSGNCVYRSDTGKSCAIGCQIPDELYTSDMEGIVIDTLLHNHPKLRPYFPDLDLARELQSIHDFSSSEDWPYKLEKLATNFGLNKLALAIANAKR